jgi:hypothetical protein
MAERRFILMRIVRPKRSYEGWGWVLVSGLLLTAFALLDGPRNADVDSVRSADNSTGCQLRVSAAELRVRASPSTDSEQVEILSEGAVVDGTTVVRDGFRELEGDRWAADQFLTPLPNTNCG